MVILKNVLMILFCMTLISCDRNVSVNELYKKSDGYVSIGTNNYGPCLVSVINIISKSKSKFNSDLFLVGYNKKESNKFKFIFDKFRNIYLINEENVTHDNDYDMAKQEISVYNSTINEIIKISNSDDYNIIEQKLQLIN